MKRFVRLFALFMFALSGLVWADSNVDIVIDPGETYAIQGDQLFFRVGPVNKTSVDCLVDYSYNYSATNAFEIQDFLKDSFTPGVWLSNPSVNGNSLTVGANSSRIGYQAFTGQVLDNNWTTNQFYVYVDGRYQCPGINNSAWTTLPRVYAYIRPQPEVVVTKTLTSLNPTTGGDLVSYNVNLKNMGSTTASNYMFRDLFPHLYLEDFLAVFGSYGAKVPTKYGDTDWYFWTGIFLNLNALGFSNNQLDIAISGRFKTDAPHSDFRNTAEITGLALDANLTNNSDSSEWSHRERRDIEFNFEPEVQFAQSGSLVTFVLDMKNNSEYDCSAKIEYNFPSGIEHVSNSQNSFLPGIEDWYVNFSSGQVRNNYVVITGLVTRPSWSDNSFFVTFDAEYTCGPETREFSTQVEIEPIVDLRVKKELLSGNPSNTGEIVQYKITIENYGSKVAQNYYLYENFPTIGGEPVLKNIYAKVMNVNRNFTLDDGVPFLSGTYLNVPALTTNGPGIVEVFVFGELISNQNTANFTNTARVEGIEQIDDLNDTGSVITNVVKKDMDLNLVPQMQYAISGDQVSFNLSVVNNGDIACNVEAWYDLTNGLSSNDLVWTDSMNRTFTIDPGNTNSYTLNADVVLLSWVSQQQYLTFDGRYDCGDGWVDFVQETAYVEPAPDLVINKELESLPPSHTGDIVVYKLKIYNRGSALASEYRLYEDFPTDFLYDIQIKVGNNYYIPAFDGMKYYLEDGAGSYMNINPGQTLEVFVYGKLKSNQDTSNFDNQAIIQNLNGEYDVSNNSSNIVTTNVQIRDFNFYMTSDIYQAISGSQIQFSIRAENNGTTNCTGWVRYVFPSGMSWVSSIPGNFGNNMTGSTFLVAGSSDQLFATVTGLVTRGNWLTGQMNVDLYGQYQCAGLEEVVNFQSELIIEPIPDLKVTKTQVSENPRNDDSRIIYEILIENIGSAPALNYELHDLIPEGLNFVQVDIDGHGHFSPNRDNSDIYRNNSNLNLDGLGGTNDSAVVKIYTELDSSVCSDGYGFENSTRVDNLVQYDYTNDLDSVTGEIQSPDVYLRIEKISEDPEFLGDVVAFRLVYGNSGNLVATGISLTGVLDNYVNNLVSNKTWVSPVLSNNKWNLNWPLYTILQNIEPGQEFELIFTGYLNSDSYAPGMPICLNAEIEPDVYENFCGNFVNNVASSCYTVTGEIVDLGIQKTLVTDVANIQKGDHLTYSFTISNNGLYSASQVVVEDVLPWYFDFESVSPGFGCAIQNYNKLVCQNIELDVNQSLTFLLTGTLADLPANGLTLVNSGKIHFEGREFNTGNNVSVATNVIPGLADLKVTKEVISGNPKVAGDTIAYAITYENIGQRTAENIKIYDQLLFSGLELALDLSNIPSVRDTSNLSGYWPGGSLLPGQSKVIEIVARLDDTYEAETLLPNKTWLITTTPQITTGNDVDFATGKIDRVQSLNLDLSVVNLTHIGMSNSDGSTDAVSGDIVEFIITYFNSGNVSLENALIQFYSQYRTGFPPVEGLDFTSWVIPYLSFGSGGTIVITGMVGPQNYQYLNGIANIYLSPTSTTIADTDTAFVIEPLGCGDGFLTWNEECDINGQIGDMLPGQECDVIQNNPSLGCVLETRYVVNTGCVDYGYFMGNVYFTGVYCSNILPVPVGIASCEDVVVTSKIQDGTGLAVNFACNAINATSNTLITMNCGNGQTFQNYGTQLIGTCNYTGELNQNSIFTGQCAVANDLTNPNCKLVTNFYPQEDLADCKDLDPVDGIVLIVDEDEDDGDLEFVCETEGEPAILEIDCDYDGSDFDADAESSDLVNKFTSVCTYDRAEEKTYTVACRVKNSEVEDECTELVMVDERTLGYCGDGVREGWEDCDLGGDVDEKTEIKDYLDNNNVLAPYDFRSNNSYCMNCEIYNEALVYSPPMCFNVSNANISVQQKEILPFWWNLKVDKQELSDGYDCAPGEIDEDMICEFVIIDGKDDRYEFTIDNCLDLDQWEGEAVLESFEKHVDFAETLKYAAGKYKLDVNDFVSEEDPFGEYKLRLERVEYDYCNSDGQRVEGIVMDRICEVNFAVTNPYLIQKSSFGATKSYGEENDIGLDNFYAINPGSDNYKILDRTDLSELMEVESSDYSLDSNLKTMITNFVDKYGVMAISVNDVAPVNYQKDGTSVGTINEVRKVPGQQIYVFKGQGKMILSQKSDYYPGEPYTVIVKGMDVEIQGSVQTNGMYLVVKGDNGEGGKVTFGYEEESDCNEAQRVNGIFIAEGGFGLEPEAKVENNMDSDLRCNNGSLYVNGVLIGSDIDVLVKNRRSHLNDWFVITSNDEDEIKAQRRDKIINGASVLIEYNSSLWSKLPPGAKEFTESLEVYKQ